MPERSSCSSVASQSVEKTQSPARTRPSGLAIEQEAKRLDADGSVDRRGNVPPLEQLHARDAAMPGRERVEDEPSAHGGLATQHDAVAAGGHDALGEAKLCVTLPGSDDSRRNVCRSDVHLESSAVRDGLELAEHDVESVGDRVRAWLDERLAPGHLVPLDSGKAHRDALSRVGALDVAIVHLRRCGRERPGLTARGEGGRPRRPCPTTACP